MQNVPLADIVPNPWRDMKLFPIDKDHVAELLQSINDHGFFGGIKGRRRRDGKVEIGCGHMRIEAARKKKGLETVPVFIEDMDDDQMLRLMTDENATQAGANPGAVLNEVAAVTRRLIEGLLASDNCPKQIVQLFSGKGMDQTRGALRAGNNVHRTLGADVIRAYLGQGSADRSHRGERQIREAITALKQSGRYDEMVDDAIAKHPPPAVPGAKPSKSKAVTKTKPPSRRKPILDERTAHIFPNEHQFSAFREAVTTPAAQKVIPVGNQLALAKEIMTSTSSQFSKKHAGAPHIAKMVQAKVEEGLKLQRGINKEEKEAYLREQREARIDDELHSANASLRSLLSALAKIGDLAKEFPAHPKILGFSERLDLLATAIQRFSKKL